MKIFFAFRSFSFLSDFCGGESAIRWISGSYEYVLQMHTLDGHILDKMMTLKWSNTGVLSTLNREIGLLDLVFAINCMWVYIFSL